MASLLQRLPFTVSKTGCSGGCPVTCEATSRTLHDCFPCGRFVWSCFKGSFQLKPIAKPFRSLGIARKTSKSGLLDEYIQLLGQCLDARVQMINKAKDSLIKWYSGSVHHLAETTIKCHPLNEPVLQLSGALSTLVPTPNFGPRSTFPAGIYCIIRFATWAAVVAAWEKAKLWSHILKQSCLSGFALIPSRLRFEPIDNVILP